MRTIRDLLAILGAIAFGWTLWSWHSRTDVAFTEALICTTMGLFVVIHCIRSEQARKEELKRNLDRIMTRNKYLEAAIKQTGDTD